MWSSFRTFAGRTRLVVPVDLAIASLLLLVALVIREPTLRQPLVESYGFRQTQTAYTALLYHEHGIDLLHPDLPVLGKPWSIPFEFPLFQAVAVIPMDMGFSPDVAMRLTGLAFFALTAVLVFGFVRSRAGKVEAVSSLCFFTLSPFSLIWSRGSLMEYMATAGAVGWCWATLTYRDTGRRLPLVIGVLAGTTACLVKLTSAVFWAAPIVLETAASDSATGLRAWVRSRLNPGLGIALFVPLALTALWVRYSDHVKAQNLQGAHLTSSALFNWNFGTINQRLEPSTWTTVFNRIDPLITGGVLWGGLILTALFLGSRRALWIGVAITVVGPIATFFNLYYVHEYYLCAVTPGIAMLMGVGLVAVLRAARVRDTRLLGATVIVLTVWASTALWLNQSYWKLAYSKINADNNPTLSVARTLESLTSPNTLVVIDGFDWSPEVLYYARRRGTMLRFIDAQVLQNLEPSHRAMLIAEPINGNLHVLRKWRWIEPVSSNILRMGNTRADLPAAGVQATTDAALARAAIARGRRLLPSRSLACSPGSSMSIAGGRGTVWASVREGLPDQARIIVGEGLSPLPAVAAVVISPDPSTGVRGPVTLSCAGVASLNLTGVSLVS
jgi:hypothetical protein